MVGYDSPSDKIVIAGNPLVVERKVQTATNMIPGRLCKKGTAQGQVVVNTVNQTPYGWIGYEHTNPKYTDEHTIDTAYTANDIIAILNGGAFVAYGLLLSGQNLTMGEIVAAAANGLLTNATAITATIPTGSTTVMATSAAPACTMGGAIPAQGMPVGMLEADCDASSANVRAQVRSFI